MCFITIYECIWGCICECVALSLPISRHSAEALMDQPAALFLIAHPLMIRFFGFGEGGSSSYTKSVPQHTHISAERCAWICVAAESISSEIIQPKTHPQFTSIFPALMWSQASWWANSSWRGVPTGERLILGFSACGLALSVWFLTCEKSCLHRSTRWRLANSAHAKRSSYSSQMWSNASG